MPAPLPFDDGALNDLVRVTDRIIDLAEQLLGVADVDIRMYRPCSGAKSARPR